MQLISNTLSEVGCPHMDAQKIELLNTSSALVDVLEGDEEAYTKIISNFDMKKVQKAYDFIINNPKLSDSDKMRLMTNSWRLHYRAEPPTHDTFISQKYLGPVADATYDRITKVFKEFMAPSPKRNLILYQSIGFGKSYLSSLITIFIAIHISLMRNPKKFFGLNPSTVLAQLLISYSLDKSSELLLEPMMNILEASPYFEKVRTKESMIKREEEFKHLDQIDRIFWTTASPTSELAFSNGSNVKLSSSAHSLLGLTIVQGTLSELAFFREAGRSDSYIMKLYNNLKERIDSRMKGNYFGRSILDSSPNDIESPIDNYCWYEADKDQTNLVCKGGRFDWASEEFTLLTEKFYVTKGGNGKVPEVYDTSEGLDPTDILTFPKDPSIYQLFKNDTVNALKNIAGIPQGAMDRIFPNYEKVEQVFIPKMKNLYTFIVANETDRPEELIWNKIVNEYFIKTEKGYRYYYKPFLPRVVSVDQSVSGDTTGICMSHVEMQKNELGILEPIYIIDFTIPICPMGGRINLDAIKLFICDLVIKGNLGIVKVTFDTYQSESNIQYIERTLGSASNKIVEKLSVDREMGPYLSLTQLINQNRIRVGRNIFLKNNFKSLRIIKRRNSDTKKVDHTIGDTGDLLGDTKWESSLIGYNAKDISDAVAASVEACRLYLSESCSELFDENEIIISPEMKRKRLSDFMKEQGLG